MDETLSPNSTIFGTETRVSINIENFKHNLSILLVVFRGTFERSRDPSYTPRQKWKSSLTPWYTFDRSFILARAVSCSLRGTNRVQSSLVPRKASYRVSHPPPLNLPFPPTPPPPPAKSANFHGRAIKTNCKKRIVLEPVCSPACCSLPMEAILSSDGRQRRGPSAELQMKLSTHLREFNQPPCLKATSCVVESARQLAGVERSSSPGSICLAVCRENVCACRSDWYKLINGNARTPNDVMGMIRFWSIDLVAAEAE